MAKGAKKRGGRKPMLIAATLFFIGMVPTLVAFIVDTTPGRYLTRCVAGMNLAGLSPFMHHLWMTDHSMSTAMKTVTNVRAWFTFYGASALGWLLFLGLPGAVAMFRTLNGKRRIYMLREKQKQLINEWGDSILPASEQNEGKEKEAEKTDNKAAAALDEALEAERAAL